MPSSAAHSLLVQSLLRRMPQLQADAPLASPTQCMLLSGWAHFSKSVSESSEKEQGWKQQNRTQADAYLLPVAAALVPAGDDAGEPLDAACARHARHNHSQGKAVVHRQSSALHLLLRASCEQNRSIDRLPITCFQHSAGGGKTRSSRSMTGSMHWLLREDCKVVEYLRAWQPKP